VWYAQPIGAFSESNIAYLFPVAGRVSAINISFIPRMSIRSGEEFVLSLPGFTGASFSNLDLLPSGVARASWNSSSFELTIRIGSACVMRDSIFTIIVPNNAGLRLPPRGVKPLVAPILFRTSAFDGPVLPTPFGSSTSLGSFSRSSLEYFLPSLRSTIQINLNFSAVMYIRAGEFVALTLPGFLGTEACNIAVQAYIDGVPSTAIRTVTWMGSKKRSTAGAPQCIKDLAGIPKDVSHMLILHVLEEIPWDVMVRVEVPRSAGISPRPDGVIQNDPRLALWTNAAEGQVAYTFPIPIEKSLPLYPNATLLASTLQFGLPKAGEVTNITITIRLNSLLYTDDTIRVSLPGFRGGVQNTNMPINISSSTESVQGFLTGNWSTGTSVTPTLLFTVTQFIEPNATIRIDISDVNGISLPPTGVRTTPRNNIIIQIQGIGGVLQPVNFHSVATVGAFCGSTITFAKPQAPTARTKRRMVMTLSICSEFQWQKDDQLTLYLPGFSGANTNAFFPKILYTGNFDGRILAEWRDASKELIFTHTMQNMPDILPEKLWLDILVSDRDIYLPYEGLRVNQTTIGLSAVAKAGVVIRNPLTYPSYVQPVGTFYDTPELTFSVPKALERTQITLAFTPEMPIPAMATVTLRLPAFTSPNGASSIQVTESISGTTLAASWNPADAKIVFTVPPGFSIGTRQRVSLVVPESAGLTIPRHGVRLNQTVGGIIMFTDSVLGPVLEDPETPIATVQAVGSLQDTVSIVYDPPKAGAPVRTTVTFTPDMMLIPGDTLQFVLSGIVGKSDTVRVGPPPGYPARFKRATWILSQSTLVLTVSDTVAEKEEVGILVPSSAGLMLPADGLRSFTSGFMGYTYSVQALYGPIPRLPLSYVTKFAAIGTLNSTSLTLGAGTCPGAPSSWRLSFKPTMNMSAGDTVTLIVPGLAQAMCNCSIMAPALDGQRYCVSNWTCQRQSAGSNSTFVSMLVSATPAGSFRASATWALPKEIVKRADLTTRRASDVKMLSGGEAINFTVNASIPAGTVVTLTINESRGLRVPRSFASYDIKVRVACV
jgi:hypothetical protein